MNTQFKRPKTDMAVVICKAVLDSIFDECDKYDSHETGGRIIGTYDEKSNKLSIGVSGVIGPGPNSKRSAVMFMQDGEHQEKIFREIEKSYPKIEHLGNWHTHHVNGYPTLSGGDIATYTRIVNHQKHNIDFFYAILVVEKCANPRRYKIKHYFLRRGDDQVYEIPESNVRVIDEPAIWPTPNGSVLRPVHAKEVAPVQANKERAIDQTTFSEMFPRFKPFVTKESGSFYWKGGIDLVDDSVVTVVVVETEENNTFIYEPTIVGDVYNDLIPKEVLEKKYKSARAAVREIERKLNREIHHKGKHK